MGPNDLNGLFARLQRGHAEGLGYNRLIGLLCAHVGVTDAGEAFARLYAHWLSLPPGTARHGRYAAQLLLLIPLMRMDGPHVRPEQQDELLRAAQASGPGDGSLRVAVLAATAMSSLLSADPANGARLAKLLPQLDEARAALPPGHSRENLVVHIAYQWARAHTAQVTMNEREFDAALTEVDRLVHSPLLPAYERLVFAGNTAILRSRQSARRLDVAAIAASVSEIEAVLARLPPDSPSRVELRIAAERARDQLAGVTAALARRRATPAPGPLMPVAEVRRQAEAHPRAIRARVLAEAGEIRCRQGAKARDATLLGEGLLLLEEGLAALDGEGELWLRPAVSLAAGHTVMANLTRHEYHLDRAISWLDRARSRAGGPEHPAWGMIESQVGIAYRQRGDLGAERSPSAPSARRDHERARRAGLDALPGNVRNVLLQSGTTHATEAGRAVTAQALVVALWCIADGALEDAVRALDTGRGVLLHAAVVARTVPELLTDAGEPALAAEWRAAAPHAADAGTDAGPAFEAAAWQAAGPGPSTGLRGRVLTALASDPGSQRLLRPPTLAETAGALRALGADALAYLVPAMDGAPGTALIVTDRGRVRSLTLKELRPDAPALAAYRDVGTASRDAGPAGAGAGPGRDGTPLGRLCDWAWEAAMGELLGTLPRPYGRAPRLVLVPMDVLGMVPWHAARTPAETGYRYAVREVQVSYIPSARLLCEVASRPPGPGTGNDALVVGDPTGDLRHAGEEAAAIHRSFYPGGTFLGRGAATPAAVMGWLRGKRGGVLHLACHGVVQAGARHSAWLSLAGGRLSAGELAEGAGGPGALDLVALAACRTQVSGRGYDEAYSLATAFLTAGARSVLGSLWPVPDDATSHLMYVAHHVRCREGLRPGQALRRAQLWMLDPGRRVPPGMPSSLADRVARIDPDDVAGWAGFTHLGW